MSSYTRSTRWAAHVSGIRYRSLEALVWSVGHSGSGLLFVVPAGREFDLSVPWWARLFIDPHDQRYLKAAALHDEMLAAGWSRTEAAGSFHEALRADGAGLLERLSMFLAVALWRFG
jgi:hypothetical protein